VLEGRVIVWVRSLWIGLLVAGPVAADPVRLDLSETVRRAEQHAPSLAPRRTGVAAARRLSQAADGPLSLPPRLELEVGPRWRGSSRDVGVDATVGAWQDLPLGGLASARARYAEGAGKQASARLEVARHDARERAALAWIDARLARELVRIRRESLEHAQSILRVASARVRAGSAAPSEEAMARATLGRARAELIEARGRRFVADTELRFVTGIDRSAAVETVGSLDAADQRLALGPLLTAVRTSQPDVALAESSAEVHERTASLVRSTGKPLLSVGPSVTRESTGDWILLARVAVPLPLVEPARFDAARASADADVARAEARYARAEVERDLGLALEEREHTREMRDVLKDGAVAPAREALRQALSQYEAGSGDASTVLTARRELLAAEEKWAFAAADVRRADVRLGRLVGRRPGNLSGDRK
jgi:outer membrane protein TolC